MINITKLKGGNIDVMDKLEDKHLTYENGEGTRCHPKKDSPTSCILVKEEWNLYFQTYGCVGHYDV